MRDFETAEEGRWWSQGKRWPRPRIPPRRLPPSQIMAAGGNAMDAAIAASAVQCVVEPGSTGIGGDCFALLAREGSGDIMAYNGSGRAPAATRAEWFAEQGLTEIPRQSPHAVTVPGAVDAWTRLHADHGRTAFRRGAGAGDPLCRRGLRDLAARSSRLVLETGTAVGGPDGKRASSCPAAARRGSARCIASRSLRATLRRIAAEGRDAFYTGAVAEDIVSYLRSLGGLHTLEDFASASGEYVDADPAPASAAIGCTNARRTARASSR